ncbi:hypothetical protein EFY87_06965 [Flexivirga caeni]|uniref:T9SS C-terminal target domain-containing protein n=1 Tax=Flexivirga caeni TaxID=2294115 RepID=A0A3M9MC79_9MICO|nr:hypothetical protein EFY87_06965 [Flexivirga caeni]
MVRVTVAALAGAGLVWGATQATGTADATRPRDVRAVTVDNTSGLITQQSLTCTGADVVGTLAVASMPSGWVKASGQRGRLEASGVTGQLSLRPGGTDARALLSGTAGRVVASGGLAAGLVAGQWQLDRGASARGLMVSSCPAPVQSGWFFGGGHDAGRVARLILVNPAETPTTVDAAVVGASGTDRAASVQGVVLAPGERKVVTLGDFGGDLAAAAVHVSASGAGVVASLTDVWLTGETPVGESTSADPESPAKDILIPGVSSTSATPVVRLAVPGSAPAIVRVRVIDGSGAVVADRVQTVAGGTAAAVDLTGLKTGSYAVRVTADESVVAAAWSRTASHGTTDMAWSTAAPSLTAPAGLALPSDIPSGSASLMLVATAPASVDVLTVGASGADSTRAVTVPANQPVVIPLRDAVAVWLRPTGQGALHAAVTVTGHDKSGGYLASVPVQPAMLTQATARLLPARG